MSMIEGYTTRRVRRAACQIANAVFRERDVKVKTGTRESDADV